MVVLGLGVAVIEAVNDDRPVQAGKLPGSITGFVAENFPNQRIIGASIDFLDYTVMLNDHISVEFDALRRWEQVESHGGTVPAGLIPAPIAASLERDYPHPVRKISRDCRGYEVELSGFGYELRFDRAGNLYGIDD